MQKKNGTIPVGRTLTTRDNYLGKNQKSKKKINQPYRVQKNAPYHLKQIDFDV